MNNPEITLGCVSNLWSRMMFFRSVGDIEYGHTHQFDHMTLLAAGALQVTVNGQATEFKAPHMILIRQGKSHELVALEDNTVAFCIHAMRTGDRVEDIVDPASIPRGMNLADPSYIPPGVSIKPFSYVDTINESN
jgi:hypothetical protein